MTGFEIDRLLREVRQGDNNAFAELYLGTRRGVYAFLYSYLRHTEDTEDAMQTVYLKIKQNIKSYDISRPALPWILQIAKNLALNIIKKRGRVEYGLDEGELERRMTEEENSFEMSDGSVMDTMHRVLSPEEERIVVLYVIFGYKHREIADELGLPLGTVTSKYKRSLEKMRAALGEEGGA
ncbi:MAG: RNA polymerase sigma factor [Clostridia bacterium]|nr:RNA polymerase sigma factor [Clostridia bacterium]